MPAICFMTMIKHLFNRRCDRFSLKLWESASVIQRLELTVYLSPNTKKLSSFWIILVIYSFKNYLPIIFNCNHIKNFLLWHYARFLSEPTNKQLMKLKFLNVDEILVFLCTFYSTGGTERKTFCKSAISKKGLNRYKNHRVIEDSRSSLLWLKT